MVLDSKGKHPYVALNGKWQAELRGGTPQSFKKTYLGTDLRGHYYNIQALDSKYLVLSGMAVNGSRLITQSAVYRWYIVGKTTRYMISAENQDQRLNTSAKKLVDGKAIILRNLTSTYDTRTKNYRFIFEFAI